MPWANLGRSDFFNSRACVAEMRIAVERRMPILLVLETDPQHGGGEPS